jgi:hypothetical protein
VNEWFVPLSVVKTSDQSVTSSTALINDSVLVLPVAANRTYELFAYIVYDGGTQGSSDLKFQFAGPVGQTTSYTPVEKGTGGGYGDAQEYTGSSIRTAGTAGAGNNQVVLIHGTVTIGGTAGNYQFTWAQNTSSGTATRVRASSRLRLQRIS